MFTAGIVLAIMVLPTISAVSREALSAVSRQQREAAMSLGATRWEATRLAVFGPAMSGIVGAILLGLGRALGETIAVTLVIGNINRVPTSLFSPGQTISSLIATDLNSAVAEGPAMYGALIELGLILLLLTLAVNVVARLLIWRIRSGEAGGVANVGARPASASSGRPPSAAPSPPSGGSRSSAWRRAALARLPQRVRRRHASYLVVAILCLGATLLAIAPLASIVLHGRPERGIGGRPADVLHRDPAGGLQPGPRDPPLSRSAASDRRSKGRSSSSASPRLIAIPVGILIGVYLAEYGRNRLGPGVSFVTDVMTGIPSILLGVFVLALFLATSPTSRRARSPGAWRCRS